MKKCNYIVVLISKRNAGMLVNFAWKSFITC